MNQALPDGINVYDSDFYGNVNLQLKPKWNAVNLEYLNVAATRIKRAQKDAELNYKLYKEGYKSGTQSYAELLVALNVALNAEKSTASDLAISH